MNMSCCRNVALAGAAVGLSFASAALAGGPAIVPDNGFGSANLPPIGGVYNTVLPSTTIANGNMNIIDGLSPGDTIASDATLGNFFYNPGGPGNVYSFAGGPHQVGGSLGGDKWASDGTLQMPMLGTGSLAGFNRNIAIPFSFEVHSAPHTPFAPVQTFATDFFRGFGQITNPGAGDPDFDLLRIVAGTDFGMPSPGYTQFTQSGPNWSVDSFFDITYRIDFVGRPGGQLSGRSGSTTGTVRIQIGEAVPAPGAAALLSLGGLVATRRRRA